jgi:hypothetical protein
MTTKDFFTTINLDLSSIDIDSMAKTFTHGYEDPTEDKSLATINFYNINPTVKDYVKSLLPMELQTWIRNVRVSVVEGRIVTPHRDHRGAVCINYYFIPGSARTTFWTPKSTAIAFKAKGEHTSNIYNFEDLIERCSFVAESNSCYLLNTGEIHSVSMDRPDSVRKMIQLTFAPEMTYEPVLNKLTELNLIEKTK